MSCETMRPALGAYVLGGLDPDEAAAVRRHLEVCEECAAEHDLLAPMPGLLSLAGGAEEATSEPLSPAFEERLLDAYARDRSSAPGGGRYGGWRWSRTR
jgi:anti-sigma factor RsiW